MSAVATTIRVLGLAACLVVAGCQAQSNATNAPTPGAPSEAPGSPLPTPSAAATETAAPTETAMPSKSPTPAGPFTLTSSAFAAGGSIPRTYTCDGQDASPPLQWSGAPDRTVALALIVDDPDAGGFIHWVMFNVDATASGGLPTGLSASPDAPPQGRNSFGRVGYGGPCPPSGTHHYVFRLLALDAALPLTGTPKASQVLDAAKGHTLGEAKLTATYHRA